MSNFNIKGEARAAFIKGFMTYLAGGLAFKNIKRIVETYEDVNLSNEEKHKAATKDISDMAMGLAKWVIDVGIKLAIAYIKSKSGAI